MHKKLGFSFLYLIVLCSFTHNFVIQFTVNLLTLFFIFPYRKFNRGLLSDLSLLFIPIIIGGYGFFKFLLGDAFRDLYYFMNPLVFAAIGYSIAKRTDFITTLKVFVKLGIFYSIVHLFLTFNFLLTKGSFDFLLLRNEISSGNPIVLISLFLLIFSEKFSINLKLQKMYMLLYIGLHIIVFILFGSRTYLIISIVFFVFLYFKKIKTKQVLIMATILIVASLAVVGIANNSSDGNLTFTDKLLLSFSEMALKDYDAVEDMANNLRGFEAFMAFNSFYETSLPGKFIGQGFGSLIDLHTFIPYGETERRYVPIIHNGYLFILVKIGLFGLIFYFWWYLRIYFKSSRANDYQLNDLQKQFMQKLIRAGIISLLFTNLVITGIFNPETEFLQMFIFALFSALRFRNNANNTN